ncbi:Uncharacterized protein dnm_054070 [Desulfonema magnum]|uniref:Uncharacterized protein n=1 Tax=Desulfonema magnum TaxID=45655 RepID=A0A975BQ17_9BACT|nr:Uncharacterized protein dnm_054070 [Desulfonema magnum]
MPPLRGLAGGGNTADLSISGFSDIFSGVRKMLFRRRKNKIFALRIRSELPKLLQICRPYRAWSALP